MDSSAPTRQNPLTENADVAAAVERERLLLVRCPPAGPGSSRWEDRPERAGAPLLDARSEPGKT